MPPDRQATLDPKVWSRPPGARRSPGRKQLRRRVTRSKARRIAVRSARATAGSCPKQIRLAVAASSAIRAPMSCGRDGLDSEGLSYAPTGRRYRGPRSRSSERSCRIMSEAGPLVVGIRSRRNEPPSPPVKSGLTRRRNRPSVVAPTPAVCTHTPPRGQPPTGGPPPGDWRDPAGPVGRAWRDRVCPEPVAVGRAPDAVIVTPSSRGQERRHRAGGG